MKSGTGSGSSGLGRARGQESSLTRADVESLPSRACVGAQRGQKQTEAQPQTREMQTVPVSGNWLLCSLSNTMVKGTVLIENKILQNGKNQ